MNRQLTGGSYSPGYKEFFHMNRNIVLIFLAVVCSVAASLFFLLKDRPRPEPVQTPGPEVIAKVGPREIRVEDFQREMRRRGGAHPEQVDKEALLREVIEDEVLMARAIETGLDKDPEMIRRYRNMLIAAFKRRHLIPRIENKEVTEAEVQAYYESHPDEFTRPAKRRLALLFMAVPPAFPDEKARARMAIAREKALTAPSEKGFGQLAVRYSEDQATRYKGGDIGWVEEGKAYRWPPAVLTAGFSLEDIGDTSDIIAAEDGVYLLKLLDRRSTELRPPDKVAGRIRHKLMREKDQVIKENFQREMRAATEVKIYPEILKSVSIPSDATQKDQPPPNLP